MYILSFYCYCFLTESNESDVSANEEEKSDGSADSDVSSQSKAEGVELLGADHLEDSAEKRVEFGRSLELYISMKSRFYSSAHSWFCTICYQAFYYKERHLNDNNPLKG